MPYPRLFPVQAGSDAEPESFVFSLLALLLGLSVGESAEIPNSPLLARRIDGVVDPASLRPVLEAGCNLVNEALSSVIGLKLNQSTPRSRHPELLIVSLVARAALVQCDPLDGFSVSLLSGDDRKDLKRSIRHHYLYDQIRREWKGQTYTLATNRVWSRRPRFNQDGSVEDPGQLSDHYTFPVDVTSWGSALADWFNEYQKSRVQSERGNVREVDRLFLRYVYAYILNFAENEETTFDIEHVFPVERLARLVLKDEQSDGWPISCISNLALLPSGLNRSKKSQTISEYVDESEALGHALSADHLAKLRTFLLLDDLAESNIPQLDGEDKMDLDSYMSFLETRWDRLVAKLLANLGIE